MAKEAALAKLYDSKKYKVFKKALQNSRVLDKGPQILELADTYAKNSDMSQLNTKIVGKIADKTREVISK